MATHKVLVENSEAKCSHGQSGVATFTASSSKLKVGGKAVLVKDDTEGCTIGGPCSNSPPPPSRVPCTAVVPPVTTGYATRLKVGGKAVVLETWAPNTNAVNTTGTLSVTDAKQSKLKAT